ncbi:MAG: dTDP-glucose 4,6-dehydratase [Acidobacteria bacterium]|nr:MAG: dTDP-glucose 4,6-dehydratase [Acidobacteriota bacterium]PYV03140.1 MAG: dTDP-glucose 4,6-dehydratase [Acidobacteriota bacterium]PYV36829.1 MAG: dTDP-glucose 4,6-dehydratase [Acidobacteriota bacterium]
MRLLVTGGAGFIGSNFVRYVLSRYADYEVLNLDKLTYAGNLENLEGLENHPRHTFFHGDICDPDLVGDVLKRGVDAVVNFAAESHVDRSILDASDFARTNVVGALNLLEPSRKNRILRFLQISTDEVYGSLGPTGAFVESSPIAPNSPYAATKAAADLLVRSYHHTYGFPAIITRCSNNYGPYQFPEKLMPLLITNALAGLSLPLYGDGLYVRDWIHVQDHCAAVDRILHHGKSGEVYNIGARQEMANLEIARLILKSLGKPESLITLVKDRPGHDRRYAIDPSKLKQALGWKPRISFHMGLQETIDWYRHNAAWVEHVRSGAYLSYYDRMYGQRQKTLSEL